MNEKVDSIDDDSTKCVAKLLCVTRTKCVIKLLCVIRTSQKSRFYMSFFLWNKISTCQGYGSFSFSFIFSLCHHHNT